MNFLCICTYFKGSEFLKSCKEEGNNVYLLTRKSLEHEDWPWDYIDEVLYIDTWVLEHVINGIAYKFRSIKFDRFVALDDFDVEGVASLREHFRMPGMGETTARFFRDKLAMRIKAKESGINVPDFTSLLNDGSVNHFLDQVSPPWLIKPRGEASATGIKKVHSKEEAWHVINDLGDDRHRFLIERFAPGDVYHVDSLNFQGETIFTKVSQYLDTPFEVAHGGGVFRSHTIETGSEEEKELAANNRKVMSAFGMEHGASHTEFIKTKETGEIYFLETSSRVGGANLAEMVEMASGVNLWREWAKIETAVLKQENYELPEQKNLYSGIVVSLSRYEHPDTSSFTDPEIVWRMNKPWHIGLIVAANTRQKVLNLLNVYTDRIANEFHASAPPKDSHTEY